MRAGFVGIVGGFLFLIIRGTLLWLLAPIGSLIWLVTFQWVGSGSVSLGCFLGWLDNNMAYVIQRGPLWWAFPKRPVGWIRARDKAAVTHRLRGYDFY